MPPLDPRAAAIRVEKTHASPRFRDGVFQNSSRVGLGLKKGTALSTMSEYLLGGQRRTPPAPLPSVNPKEAWGTKPETGLRATWLGHSTVLLEVDGARVLTDPVWGDRASPVSFAGPKRFQPVPIPLSELGALDAVVISHDHFDHLDATTIPVLARTSVPFVVPLGVGAHLEAWGVQADRITELDWWESATLPKGLTVTAAPSQHFSGRGVADRNRTLWAAMVVRSERHGVFFSGDTGLTPEYRDITERLGPFDLVMLEVGAWHPAWGDIHLGPENALEAHKLLGGGAFLPVHWGTFNLALHAWDEPAETLLKLAPASDRLVMPMLGAPVEPSRVERVEPWWRAAAALDKKQAAALPVPTEPADAVRLEEPID